MNISKGIKGFLQTRICPSGHDKDIGGRLANGACCRCNVERVKAWTKLHPRKLVAAGRNAQWRRLGIHNADGTPFTVVNYDHAYQIQQGRCVGCNVHQSGIEGTFHADHNHMTGVFRALLCSRCNQALGLARDNPLILRRLASFIEDAC